MTRTAGGCSGHPLRGLLLAAAAAAFCLALSARASASASSPLDFAAIMPYPAGDCGGSFAECLGGGGGGGGGGEWGWGEGDEELAMDSETNRRILAARRYISYGALRRNTVPCSRRGASYYNCRAGASANPYSRACSRITRCRS